MLVRSLMALRNAGHDVTLVAPENGPLMELLDQAGIPVEIVPFPVLRKSLLRPTALLGLILGLGPTAWKIRRLLRAHRPDALYLNTITVPHWVVLGRLFGVKQVVCHVRELEETAPLLLNRAVLAPLLAAHALVANSQATRRYLGQTWAPLGRRCTVVYNGFEPRTPPARTTPAGRPRLVLAGRLSPRKGQDVALEALHTVVAAGHDVELHLLGTTFRGYEWFQTQLADRAKALGLADRLVFRGYVKDVAGEFAQAAVALVPSLLEPFGNVAVEAQLAGCPVVVSDVGGLPEIVDDGLTGLVVPPGDAAALAEATLRLLNDQGFAETVAQKAQAEATERFDATRYERELETALTR
jgi:glycosyltransferase involved in cell wall biosynthesis